jgi:hypothetical protein
LSFSAATAAFRPAVEEMGISQTIDNSRENAAVESCRALPILPSLAGAGVDLPIEKG